MAASVWGIEITDRTARLVAADFCEERGETALAVALRDADRPLVLRNGQPCYRELFEVGKPGKGADVAKRVLKAIGSRKRKLAVNVCTHVILTGRYWDGGSKSEYAPFNLHTMQRLSWFPSINPMNGPHDEEQPTATGIGIVSTGTFCGKDATPCLSIHPLDAHLFGLDYIPAFPEEVATVA